ncbi:uncharacterized protein METZ01_LOCUS469407 [marine metagenome]|uniref:Uncharacterized protein n=1 Tax=marine metagenome TaxID=408172 RepID=A0A383B9Q5_9ZZZZ
MSNSSFPTKSDSGAYPILGVQAML